MKQRVIVDTGPLVAAINRKDTFHAWAVQQLSTIQKPLYTCEAVVSEASFLLQQVYGGRQALLAWLAQGLVMVDFRLSDEIAAVQALMQQYESVPMSLADACLVRMAELRPGSDVFTMDADFVIYRLNRNQPIPVIMPG
jgi:predicted nucleic acid-binding protein